MVSFYNSRNGLRHHGTPIPNPVQGPAAHIPALYIPPLCSHLGPLIKHFQVPSSAGHPSPIYEPCLSLLTYVTLCPVPTGHDVPGEAISGGPAKEFSIPLTLPPAQSTPGLCLTSLSPHLCSKLVESQKECSKMNMSELGAEHPGVQQKPTFERTQRKSSAIELVISGAARGVIGGGC